MVFVYEYVVDCVGVGVDVFVVVLYGEIYVVVVEC